MTVSHDVGLAVRPAQQADMPAIHTLLETSSRVHLNLDWWTLEDWLASPGFLVAQRLGRIAGVCLGVLDVSSVAWLRVVAVEEGLGTGALLSALLPPLLDALRTQAATALVCLAWPDWLSEKLGGQGFSARTQVVTLRLEPLAKHPERSEWAPLAGQVPSLNGLVRPAQGADLDQVVNIDHAAFSPEWWYAGRTFYRVLLSPARFIVTPRDGRLAGYAFGSLIRTTAHVTRLAVRPEYQQQGIGTWLLHDLIDYFGRLGVDAVTLNTQSYNDRALHLYERAGFFRVGSPVTLWIREL